LDTIIVIGVSLLIVAWLFGSNRPGGGDHRGGGRSRCRCRLYESTSMETLLIFGLLLAVGYCSYKYGKRLGSWLGFRVGRRRSRHRHLR
jgi:hypothetical protein